MLSHLHRLVFVHVPKCAGISIETALGGLPARQITEQHWSSREIKRHYPDEWESYHRFAVVRHPLARARSYIRFMRRFDPVWRAHLRDVPDESLLRALLFSSNLLTNRSCDFMITDDVEVLRFEQLASDWAAFAERNRLPPTLPQRNSAPAAPSTPWSATSEHLVAAAFANDYTRFGYELPATPLAELPLADQGAVAWLRLHAWARRLPERFSPDQRRAVDAWLQGWRDSLPDPRWAAHVNLTTATFTGHIEASYWADDLHEQVNVALGKPLWDPWQP